MDPLPEEPKMLFVEWLKVSAAEMSKKGSKMGLVYNRAFEKLRAHPQPITDIKELKKVPFVGDKTVTMLCKKLLTYCTDAGYDIPAGFRQQESLETKEKRLLEIDLATNDKKRKRTAEWVPRRRTGPWAIVIGLFMRDRKNTGLRKDEIISAAAKYCDSSFTANPGGREFYSAWNGIKTLLKHDWVLTSGGSPKIYQLTEKGQGFAKVLLEKERIQLPSQEPTCDDSFDNGIRVSPDRSISSLLHTSISRDPINTKNVLQEIEMDSNVISPCKARTELVSISSPLRLVSQNMLFLDPDYPMSASKTSASSTSTSETSDINQQLPPTKNNTKLVHDEDNKIYGDIPYSIWSPSDYEVLLIIDSREIRSRLERDFFESRLTSLDVKCDIRPLAVGDVVWVAKHKITGKEVILNYIGERKRLDDLAASIKDGRFQEQKSRLKKTEIKNVFYIVEDAGLADSEGLVEMSDGIQTSISMTMTVSNFNLKRCKTADHTIAFLASLTNVIDQHYRDLQAKLIVVKPRTVHNQNEYGSIMNVFRDKFENRTTKYECVYPFPIFQEALTKTGMYTIKEMFISMLMTIRGISLEKAITIQRHFKVPKNLIQYYAGENSHLCEESKKVLLVNLFLLEIGNKKIGKVALANVYEIWGCK